MIKIIQDASHTQAKGVAIHLQYKFTHLLIGRSKRRWLELLLLKPNHSHSKHGFISVEIFGHRLSAHFRYLSYVLRHKWYVFQECLRYGLIWPGIIHDWSKFTPSEWRAYVEYFYGEGVRTDKQEKKAEKAFNGAWNHHQKRNAHHWQYWVLIEDDQTNNLIALPMPDRYRKEMIADWRGAGRAQGKGSNETLPWYLEHCDVMILHEETRQWVEAELGVRS